MGIITKRNGKILMILSMVLVITGFFGVIILSSMFGGGEFEEWYMAMPAEFKILNMIFTFFVVPIGPLLAVTGIPILIVSSKRARAHEKLMDLLKSSVDPRTKISLIAQQLGINEKKVIDTISRLSSNGEPISIDYSTLEAVYNPTLLPSPSKVKKPSIPPAKVEKPSMTSYEKLSVILTILTIIVSVIVALLTRGRI